MADDLEIWFDRGVTDGLPVVPPTRERVERTLSATRRKPDELPQASDMLGVWKAPLRTRRGLGDPRVWALHPRGAAPGGHRRDREVRRLTALRARRDVRPPAASARAP